MTNGTPFVAISTLMSLLGIWVLLFWLYRDLVTDSFRQDMFALRDELFDAADDGQVDFDHPAYGLLRSTMNGFIRFTHRMTLLDVLLLAIAARKTAFLEKESSFSNRLSKELDTLDTATSTTLKNFHNRMNVMVLKHVFRSSPVLLALIVPALLGSLAVVLCLDPLLKLFRAPLDEIDSTAWHVGQEQLASVSAR